MRYILYLLTLFSISSQAALVGTSISVVSSGHGVLPTVSWSSIGGTISSGDLTQYGNKMRYFGLGIRVVSMEDGSPSPLGDSYMSTFSNRTIALAAGDTWEEAIHKYIANFGASGTYTHNNVLASAYKYEVCFLASTCSGCGNGSPSNIAYPGSCISVPTAPTTNSCDINSSIQIEHGVLAVGDVNGHSASTTAMVTCQSNANIKIRVYDSHVSLGNNIYADIYINGHGGGGEMLYSVSGAGLSLNIESKLGSVNPQPGAFSGSSVVVVDIL